MTIVTKAISPLSQTDRYTVTRITRAQSNINLMAKTKVKLTWGPRVGGMNRSEYMLIRGTAEQIAEIENKAQIKTSPW